MSRDDPAPQDVGGAVNTAIEVIRSMSVRDEMVVVFAGLPRQHGCVNGVGDQARFDYPTDVACVGHKVYVADSDNYGVRVVDGTTAEVTTA